MAIVDKIEWSKVDHEVKIQQKNRETFSPVISMFRWWARRPHAVAGAILDAARLEFRENLFAVSDPFSGGGTVAFEAAKRGLPIYAQDLYPWPSLGLFNALTKTDRCQFSESRDDLLERLYPLRQKYWRKEGDVTWELTHVIRVRVTQCLCCGKNIYLYRDPMISLASRSKDETYAFFGCAACGNVSRKLLDSESIECDRCGMILLRDKGKRSSISQVTCAHCGTKQDLVKILTENINWLPVLLQEHQIAAKTNRIILRQATENDPVVDIVKPILLAQQLSVPITPGIETDHLLQYGFRYWEDLYTNRQLEVMITALSIIKSMKYTDEIKARLSFSILGASEMAANLCRWERYHPKALEAMANHRFARTTLAVETNLLSPIGRGTIPKRLKSAEKALHWLYTEQFPDKIAHTTNTIEKRKISSGVLVTTGSSDHQPIKDKSVKLVLTDPPYHDDVQYGELSRLLHAWLFIGSGISLPDEDNEAVPNRIRNTGNIHYEEKVIECLLESKRTLAVDGRLVLTFHNKNIAAWIALSNALYRSGFIIIGVATVSAENAADHCKRDTTAFLSDLIIECKARSKCINEDIEISICGEQDSIEKKNLVAMGRALIEKINSESHEDLAELYIKHLDAIHESSVLIR